MLKTASIQHVALCHIFPHCETSLSVFRTKEIDLTQKPGENPGKTGQKPAKTGKNRQKPVKFSEPYPVIGTNNFY